MFVETPLMSYYKYMKQSRNRRYVSKEGKVFVENITSKLKEHFPIFTTEVYVEITLYFEKRYRVRDVDNYGKVLMDCIEKSGVVSNDNLVKCLRVCKERVGGSGKCSESSVECSESSVKCSGSSVEGVEIVIMDFEDINRV